MKTICKTINSRNSHNEMVLLTFRWADDLTILSVKNLKKEDIPHDTNDFQFFYDDIVDSLS